MSNRMSKVMIAFMVIAALCMTAPMLFTQEAKALATPYPIRGFILNETDVPVAGATVVLSMTGSTATSTGTSDSLGRYIVYGEEIPVEDGDVVRVTATKAGVGSGYIVHVVNFTSVDPDYARNQNVTLSPLVEPPGDLFTVTFFCDDADGVGVENVAISAVSALGVYTNVTTNASGGASATFAPGIYSFSAITNASQRALGLRNQTGTFQVIAANLPVIIHMNLVPDEYSLLGIGMSYNCLVVGTIIFAILLGVGFYVILRKGGMKGENLLDE